MTVITTTAKIAPITPPAMAPPEPPLLLPPLDSVIVIRVFAYLFYTVYITLSLAIPN